MNAFSKCHPAINLIFFLGAIGFAVLVQHPAYLVVGLVSGLVYYLLLSGLKGVKMLLRLLPIMVILTVVNPLLNTQGATVLFYVFQRPYTYEALLYGATVGGVFGVMMLWFGCYNKVLTGDKFTALFGNLIPAISLLLVMVLRMIPDFVRKTKQIAGARKSIGKGAGENSGIKGKVKDGAAVLGALTGWALESSIVTGDSMRARGYGAAKRTSFMIYRMTVSDWVILLVMAVLLSLTIVAACLGQVGAVFTPDVQLAPLSWGLVSYACYLLIPTALHIKETMQWCISRSKI